MATAASQQRDLVTRLRAMEFEFNRTTARHLCALAQYDIVLLCDDSGSMDLDVEAEGTAVRTRWEELKETVLQVVKVAVELDSDGIDVYFLNRQGMKNVTRADQLEPVFVVEPDGGTPMLDAVARIMHERAAVAKPMLLVIATDGVPTNQDGRATPQEFRDWVYGRDTPSLPGRDPEQIPLCILACTDDDSVIRYLEDLDLAPRVDVLDDYHSERRTALSINPHASFSRARYVAKALLGPLMDEYDNDVVPADASEPSPAAAAAASAQSGDSGTGTGTAAEPVPDQVMQELVTCAVCSQVMHAPVTLVPCQHSFCGCCLSDWHKTQLQQNRRLSCPTCRTAAERVVRNHAFVGIVDHFVRQNPDLAPETHQCSTMYSLSALPVRIADLVHQHRQQQS